jgi:hypothetical protein
MQRNRRERRTYVFGDGKAKVVIERDVDLRGMVDNPHPNRGAAREALRKMIAKEEALKKSLTITKEELSRRRKNGKSRQERQNAHSQIKRIRKTEIPASISRLRALEEAAKRLEPRVHESAYYSDGRVNMIEMAEVTGPSVAA